MFYGLLNYVSLVKFLLLTSSYLFCVWYAY